MTPEAAGRAPGWLLGFARLAAGLLVGPAGAHAAASDTLIASGQSVTFGGAVQGGAAENLDWIHQDPEHELIGLGVTHQQLADTQLAIARLTGSLNISSANSLAGTLEAGPGTEGTSHYTFTRVTVDGTRAVTGAFQVTGGGQYVEADQARTLMLRMRTVWLPAGRVSLQAQLGQSIGGNLPTRFVSLRADYVRRVQLYAGFAVGEGAQAVIELGPVSYQRFTDALVGIAVPLSRCTIGLTWDRLALDFLIRRTVSLSITVPIRRHA